MLRIRLQRTGRKKHPFYQVVVAENSAPIKGRVIDRLGFYNPLIKPWSFEVDLDKVEEWVKKGAQPTNTVARLLKSAGAKDADRFIIEMKDRKKKNAPDEPEEAPQPSAPAAEPAPAEDPSESQEEAPKEDEKKEDETESNKE